jgi:hypothetical protein
MVEENAPAPQRPGASNSPARLKLAAEFFSAVFMVLHFMAKKSNKVVPKKRRGRPATGRDPVTAIRLSKELRETVDRWAAWQDDEPSRSEAIRRLVAIALGLGLKAKGK